MLKASNVGAALIMYWRYEHGLTVVDLSKRIDVVPQTIHSWARTGRIPTRYWKRIKEIVGFDVSKYV